MWEAGRSSIRTFCTKVDSFWSVFSYFYQLIFSLQSDQQWKQSLRALRGKTLCILFASRSPRSVFTTGKGGKASIWFMMTSKEICWEWVAGHSRNVDCWNFVTAEWMFEESTVTEIIRDYFLKWLPKTTPSLRCIRTVHLFSKVYVTCHLTPRPVHKPQNEKC